MVGDDQSVSRNERSSAAPEAYHCVHRVFRNIRTTVRFTDMDRLSNFVEKLAQKTGRYISYASPILDGSLPDGSRVNATYTVITSYSIHYTKLYDLKNLSIIALTGQIKSHCRIARFLPIIDYIHT